MKISVRQLEDHKKNAKANEKVNDHQAESKKQLGELDKAIKNLYSNSRTFVMSAKIIVALF